MNIATAFEAGRLTLYLSGELDHHEARSTMRMIEELLDEYMPRELAGIVEEFYGKYGR